MWKKKLWNVLWSLVLVGIVVVVSSQPPVTSWVAANPWFTSIIFGGFGAWIVLNYWKEKQGFTDRPSEEFRKKLLWETPLEVKRRMAEASA
jgi:hypothetical protein